MLKESGKPKPWSENNIFRTTYFCNVSRENDKVTRWIRKFYSPFVDHPEFEFNIAMARFINWPPTLERIGWYGRFDAAQEQLLASQLEKIPGKIWGDAYIVSTCGRSMPKVQYVCEMLLPAVYRALGNASDLRRYLRTTPTLHGSWAFLKRIFGIQSFMAGQLLADYKNTKDHPLRQADDWWTFAVPGPGSLRGVSWITYGDNKHSSKIDFFNSLQEIRRELEAAHCEEIRYICNQDLQNCLCEFDKFMRIFTGIGRSKRSYDGT